MIDNHAIGTRLREQRVSVGLSQAAACEGMRAYGHGHFYPHTIVRLEKGERPLRLDETPDLCAVLGLSLSDLLGE